MSKKKTVKTAFDKMMDKDLKRHKELCSAIVVAYEALLIAERTIKDNTGGCCPVKILKALKHLEKV